MRAITSNWQLERGLFVERHHPIVAGGVPVPTGRATPLEKIPRRIDVKHAIELAAKALRTEAFSVAAASAPAPAPPGAVVCTASRARPQPFLSPAIAPGGSASVVAFV